MQYKMFHDLVENARKSCPEAPELKDAFRIPLTGMQREIFVASEFRPEDNFNVCGRLDLECNTSLKDVYRATQKVIARNLNLNMRPERHSEGLFFTRPGCGRLVMVDVSILDTPESYLKRWIDCDVSAARHFANDPIFEIIVFKIREKIFSVYYRFHHIIMDGYSGFLFSSQLVQFISDNSAHESSHFSLNDYIKSIENLKLAEKRAKSDDQMNFWREYLSEYERYDLFSFIKSGGVHTASAVSHPDFKWDSKKFFSKYRIYFPVFFISSIAILISRICQTETIYLSLPVNNRIRSTRNVISSFSNIIPLKLKILSTYTVKEVFKTVKIEILKVLRYSKTRGEEIHHDILSLGGCTFGPLVNILDFQFPSNVLEGHCRLQNLSSGPRPETTFTAIRTRQNSYEISVTGADHTNLKAEINNLRVLLSRSLKWIQENPQKKIDQLEIISNTEKSKILYEWNKTYQDISIETLPIMFEKIVQKYPENTAVLHNSSEMSYRDINAQANQLARYLCSLNIGPGHFVAVCLPPQTNFITAMLAIWKAGAAYTPIDIHTPTARIASIIASLKPAAIITSGRQIQTIQEQRTTFIDLSDPLITAHITELPSYNLTNIERIRPLKTSDAAYAIYTSGSTGEPKAVVIEHQNIPHHIKWQKHRFGIHSKRRILLVASIAFDSAMGQIFTSIFNGATLVLCNRSEILDDMGLIGLLERNKIDYLDIVPSLLEKIPPSSVDRRCTINFGGEALSSGLAKKWAATHKIFNSYGPSESTIDAVVTPVLSPKDCMIVPIGRPVWNARIYILDAGGEPVPVGVAGELYVGGAGVARGYLNQPELTAERFLPDPFSPLPGARMYRTGDLACYQPDGTIIFLGRADDQIKIRGFRIEPGEIEARLTEQPTVRSAVVIAREDMPGDRRLVGYVIPETGQENCNPAELRRSLAARLPDYMVPAAIVMLDALPLTPNGKLDRRALPAPDSTNFLRPPYEEPLGPVEEKIAEIWSSLLGVSPISRHDNFFELGGHSLLAARLLTALRANGMNANVGLIFASHNLVELALGITANSTPTPPEIINEPKDTFDEHREAREAWIRTGGDEANISSISILSPMQEGLLYHHIISGDNDPYIISTMLSFNTKSKLDSYLEAMEIVIQRHDTLRSAFLWEGLTVPVQIALKNIEIKLRDLSGELLHSLSDALTFLSDIPHDIDLSSGTPIEFLIAHSLDDNLWALRINVHHLVIDQWSYDLLTTEILLSLDNPKTIISNSSQYADFVPKLWSNIHNDASKKIFSSMFHDFSEPTTPFGLCEHIDQKRKYNQTTITLQNSLTKTLREQASKIGVSLSTIFHLAWAIVVARTSSRTEAVFGTILFGRMNHSLESQRTIGLFINTLPIRIKIDNLSVIQKIKEINKIILSLIEVENVPLSTIKNIPHLKNIDILFNSVFNFQHRNARHTEKIRNGLIKHGINIESHTERTNYPLSMTINDYENNIDITCCVLDTHSSSDICHFLEVSLEEISHLLKSKNDKPVLSISIIDDNYRDFLYKISYGQNYKYENLSFSELFYEKCKIFSENIAVKGENFSITYSEINHISNKIARYLLSNGIRNGSTVGVSLTTGYYLAPTIIAILKCGATYFPIDPDYAADRTNFIIHDANPEIIVTMKNVLCQNKLPKDRNYCLIDSDDTLYAIEKLSAKNLQNNLENKKSCDGNVAYVIYTSGSTGTPKGVIVYEKSMLNYALSAIDEFKIDPRSTLLLFSSINFDASISDIFTSILSGGCLIALNRKQLFAEKGIENILKTYEVTHALLPPSAIEYLNPEKCKPLDTLIVGGEPLSALLAEKWKNYVNLFNAYGPTEATICSTIWYASDTKIIPVPVPIGRPIRNVHTYILDAGGEPVPVGVAGELYVGGAGVARGYLNQPELTAERFLPDPFSPLPGARMYRTGDLACYQPDGTIIFLGRADDQIKIRGFRIEPGEIEARLTEQPTVRSAVVIAREDMPGDRRLVGYVIPETGQENCNPAELRRSLAARLPDYMVPAAIVMLDALPLTPNGKLDRRALPAPDSTNFLRPPYEEPLGPVEEKIAEIWSSLLGVSPISRHDNFFELGGHSLLATRLKEQMHRAELHVGIASIFSARSLAELASTTDIIEFEEIEL